jgi:hypothetical protein
MLISRASEKPARIRHGLVAIVAPQAPRTSRPSRQANSRRRGISWTTSPLLPMFFVPWTNAGESRIRSPSDPADRKILPTSSTTSWTKSLRRSVIENCERAATKLTSTTGNSHQRCEFDRTKSRALESDGPSFRSGRTTTRMNVSVLTLRQQTHLRIRGCHLPSVVRPEAMQIRQSSRAANPSFAAQHPSDQTA